jgi:D-amino-acid dehydrogenase
MTSSPPQADIAVIGGGIVGLSCALHLAMRGRSVILLDPRDARRAASFGNAGVINRASLFPVAGPGLWPSLMRYACNRDRGVSLRYRALPGVLPWLRGVLSRANESAWREAAAALDPLTAGAIAEHRVLAEVTGATALLSQQGYLKLYRTQAAFEAASLERQILAHHRVEAVALDEREIADLEPALTRRFARGLLFPESGAVTRPGELVERYRAALAGHGALLIDSVCDRIESGSDDVTVHWPGGALQVSQAILAAGAWSGPLARKLGYAFPLAAERGYHRHFQVDASPTRPFHDTGGAYVVSPAGDGVVRLLSGIEIAAPGDPPNHRQISAVTGEARRTLKLGEPVESEPCLGSRPSTPDGLPIIGRAPRHPNVIFAFGHGHIGLSTGPLTGRIVADIADQRHPPIPVEPFAPERFRP